MAYFIEYLHQNSLIILANNYFNYRMQCPYMELLWKSLLYLVNLSINKTLSGDH